jgi:hypothetical protein
MELRRATATAAQECAKVWEDLIGDASSNASPPLKRLRGSGVVDMPSPIHTCIQDGLAEQESGLRIAWSNASCCESLVVVADVAAGDVVLTFQLILAVKAQVTADVLPGRLTVETASWSCQESEEQVWVDETNLKGRLTLWNFLRHATADMNCSVNIKRVKQHRAKITVQVKVCTPTRT